ncbi:hypothetical protein ACGH7X_20880 [Streptomyces sp. BBFR51]|uniref:hypothetical protein n=1 Tax=Streptomyces sp. BBFR51 TaxID=3372856 RepID=UPI0037DCF106
MGRHAVRAGPLPDRDVVFRPTRRDIDPVTEEPTAYALWDRHGWQEHGEYEASSWPSTPQSSRPG